MRGLVAAATAIVIAGGIALIVFVQQRNRIEEPGSAATSRHPPAENRSAVRPATPAPVADSRPATTRAAERNARPTRSAATASPAPPAPETGADEATPAKGTLSISSDVPDAQVFLDRKFIGAAPVTASDIVPGSHQLNVSAPGFDPHVETINVEAGLREISVRFRVVKLDAAIHVVHKHRFGSCRGQLVATPEGIRYDTDDKEDGFRASLREIETLQVDYLNKNLRVQLRQGRRYDFTDPDGNADRLFVFHRDVERARERLRTVP
jgi:hypothetical protein